MHRHHPLPFGAELVGDGVARFRLWAPSAKTVDLVVGGRRHRLERDAEGWCEHTTRARVGERYSYVIDGQLEVPDIAARALPGGVHQAGALTDPRAFDWKDEGWTGRPWSETVLYELHVGTFTPEGTLRAAVARLDYLADLGITAVELMPLSASPGHRGWGYDGVAPFAPWAAYGEPDDLKFFVEQAHLRGLMVILDVVYNHFGPEGCYLGSFARPAFDERRPTPWGDGLAFDVPFVRDLFVHNALYWVQEMHMDGLRIDASEWIADDLLLEMAQVVRAALPEDRHVHLILEAVALQDRLLNAPFGPDAQWSDEIHHPLHVLATGERTGVLAPYADHPHERAARALATGTGFAPTEAAASALPRTAFVAYSTNHDQIGNRALGDRVLEASPARAAAMQALLLMCPSVPMLFMGEEWGATTAFCFFSGLEIGLRDGVRKGRRHYLRGQPGFSSKVAGRAKDPFATQTFAESRLDWADLEVPHHAARLARVRAWLAARAAHLAPRIDALRAGSYHVQGEAFRLTWPDAEGRPCWHVEANLSDATGPAPKPPSEANWIAGTHGPTSAHLPPWSVAAYAVGAPMGLT